MLIVDGGSRPAKSRSRMSREIGRRETTANLTRRMRTCVEIRGEGRGAGGLVWMDGIYDRDGRNNSTIVGSTVEIVMYDV